MPFRYIIPSQNDFIFTFYDVAMCRAKTKLNAKLEKRLHFTMHTSLQRAIENVLYNSRAPLLIEYSEEKTLQVQAHIGKI